MQRLLARQFSRITGMLIAFFMPIRFLIFLRFYSLILVRFGEVDKSGKSSLFEHTLKSSRRLQYNDKANDDKGK